MATEFEKAVEELFLYFSGDYPKRCSKNTKRIIRRRAKSYCLIQGTLFYVGNVGQGKRLHGKGMAEVISCPEEQSKRIRALHVDSAGAHFGRDKTLEKALKRFYWPGIATDVKEFIKKCNRCPRLKPVQKPTESLHPVTISSVWSQVGVDIIGPLNETTDGNKYIITLTDYLSKWPEAKAVKEKNAKTIAVFLYEVMVRLGCFKVVRTNQGRDFIDEINRELFQLTGTEHRIVSAYDPQTNRFNQTLQCALIKVCNDKQDDWDQHISPVLFGYRTSVHSSTQFSPFFLMYGRDPVLPIDLKSKSKQALDNCEDVSVVVERMNNVRKSSSSLAKKNVIKAQLKQKKDHDRRHQSNRSIVVKTSTPETKTSMSQTETEIQTQQSAAESMHII